MSRTQKIAQLITAGFMMFAGAGVCEVTEQTKKSEKSSSSTAIETAKCQFEQGLNFEKNNKTSKALTCFKQAYKLDPSVSDYPAAIGKSLLSLGLPEGLKYLEKSVSMAGGEKYKFDLEVAKAQSQSQSEKLLEESKKLKWPRVLPKEAM